MKIAYIAHPIGGDVEANLEKIQDIARQINLEEPETVPFAPYYLDCICMDDSNPAERRRGMKNNTLLMLRGFIDELRLYGERISPGMADEIRLAHNLGINIRAMNPDTEAEYNRRWGMVTYFSTPGSV